MASLSELSDISFADACDILKIPYVIPLLNELFVTHEVGRIHKKRYCCNTSNCTQIIKYNDLYFAENNGEKTLIENLFMKRDWRRDHINGSVIKYINTIIFFEKYKDLPMGAYFDKSKNGTIIIELYKYLQMQYLVDKSYFE